MASPMCGSAIGKGHGRTRARNAWRGVGSTPGCTRVGSAVFAAPTVGLGRQVPVGTAEVVSGGLGLQVLCQFLKKRQFPIPLQLRIFDLKKLDGLKIIATLSILARL